MIILFIAFPLWCTARIWWTGTHTVPGRGDAILIMGAAQYDGRPSAVLEARLQIALDIYQQGDAPRIVTVGGGAPGDRTTEAAASKTWLMNRGIPSKLIAALPQGRDTLQSILAAESYLHKHAWKSVVIVTDAWHCLRVETMARDHGLAPTCAPVATGPAATNASHSVRYLIRETGAYLAYVTFGRIGIHLSDRGSSVGP
ncbi:MAG TPA: YdcF family protein [Candidatus Nanopelagicaceae bacterium]|nr:YdcF family protein [Candidatus Nanopelagicaceae bacterium]